jgi:hypothetical protein
MNRPSAGYNILVVPYRDAYFVEKFGLAVRDVQIIAALAMMDDVKKIKVVNRPVSIYERVLGKWKIENPFSEKVELVDKTSNSFVGPLKGRKWFQTCYRDYAEYEFYDEKCTNIILDFHPIARIDFSRIRYDFLWYDLIDNFVKHNRFDDYEKALVKEKYTEMRGVADLVTGVSKGALIDFPNGVVLPNAAGLAREPVGPDEGRNKSFDMGFIGFITDKFDIEFVERQARNGFTVGIFGKAYSKAVLRKLKKIPNLKYCGEFRHEDIPRIIARFRIGIIPYLKEKSHDESPLKMYQYIKYGVPVVTSIDYEMRSKYILNYNDRDYSDIEIKKLHESTFCECTGEEVRSLISDEHYMLNRLECLLSVKVRSTS